MGPKLLCCQRMGQIRRSANFGLVQGFDNCIMLNILPALLFFTTMSSREQIGM